MTEPRELQITFTENPQQEIDLVQRELNLSTLTDRMNNVVFGTGQLTEEEETQLAELLATLQEMFSLELPELKEEIEKNLRLSSRDINLSRILRERGIIRFYRLIKETNEDGIPLFMTVINPLEDKPFQRQEEFITWVALDAHMPRSTLFMRFATYDKLRALGFELDDAFRTVITKPYAMRQVLNMLGTWDREKNLIGVEPEIAAKVAQKVLTREDYQKVQDLADSYVEDPSEENLESLTTAFEPALGEFIRELALHPNTREMMDYVRHDVLGKAEISYSWHGDSLIVSITRKALDDSGTEFIVGVEEIPFSPDYPFELPEELVFDILERLPIKNRRDVLSQMEREKKKKKEEEGVDKLVF